MWSTESGHFVKVVKCHNEVNDDNRNESEKELHGRLQARSSGAGYGARLQDFRSGAEPGHWGQCRIQAELASLGFKVCARTVARYMRRPYDGRPSPSWRQFLNQHANDIWACDLFTVHTVWFQTLYVFFVIHHGTRELIHAPVTAQPNSEWLAQQRISSRNRSWAACIMCTNGLPGDTDGVFAHYSGDEESNTSMKNRNPAKVRHLCLPFTNECQRILCGITTRCQLESPALLHSCLCGGKSYCRDTIRRNVDLKIDLCTAA